MGKKKVTFSIGAAKLHTRRYGWSQKLGYSKEELGIRTNKSPEPLGKKIERVKEHSDRHPKDKYSKDVLKLLEAELEKVK